MEIQKQRIPGVDLYRLLDLDYHTSTKEEIKKAHLNFIKHHHPDKKNNSNKKTTVNSSSLTDTNRANKLANYSFETIDEGFKILLDDELKKAYDTSIGIDYIRDLYKDGPLEVTKMDKPFDLKEFNQLFDKQQMENKENALESPSIIRELFDQINL